MRRVELKLTKQNGVDCISYDLVTTDVYDDKISDKVKGMSNIIPYQYSVDENIPTITSYANYESTVETYIKNVLDKKAVLGVISGIIGAYEIGQGGVPISYLVKEPKYIYLDSNNALRFMVLPIKQEAMALAEIPSLFREILSNMRFDEKDGDNYVARMLTMLNSNDFTLSKFKEYVEKQLEQMGLFYSKENGVRHLSEHGMAGNPSNNSVKVNKLGVINNMQNANRQNAQFGGQMGMPVNGQMGNSMNGAPANGQMGNPMGTQMNGMPSNGQMRNPMGAPMNGAPANGQMGNPMGAPMNGAPANGPMGNPMGTPMNGMPANGPMGNPMGAPMNGMPSNGQMGNPMGAPMNGAPANGQMGNPMGAPMNGAPANGPMGNPMGAPMNGMPANGQMGNPMGAPMNGTPANGQMGNPMGTPMNGAPANGPMGTPMGAPMNGMPANGPMGTPMNSQQVTPMAAPVNGASEGIAEKKNDVKENPMSGLMGLSEEQKNNSNSRREINLDLASDDVDTNVIPNAVEIAADDKSSEVENASKVTNAQFGNESVNAVDNMPSVGETEEIKEDISLFSNGIADSVATGNTQGLIMGQLNVKPVPHIIRKRTGEVINITKSPFKIGKSKINADYTIENNTAISRVHCTIVQKNGVNYISDNGSTNKTYINGELLEQGQEVLLKNRTVIQMGDEEFTFLLRKGE